MTDSNFEQRRKLACEIIEQTIPLLLSGYSPSPGTDKERLIRLQTATKSSPRDLVTYYDKATEALLINQLNRAFPNETVLGEERISNMGIPISKAIESIDHFWLIDPIDGTKNYYHAYPYFCSTLSFVIRQGGSWKPVVAVTCDPTRKEIFSAALNSGSFLNESPIKVSKIEKGQGALFSSGFAAARKGFADHAYSSFRKISETSLGVRRGGSAALDLAYVAAGRIDGYWERGLDPWDIAAGLLLVSEANGKTSHFNGEPLNFLSGEIVASNSYLHSWLLSNLED